MEKIILVLFLVLHTGRGVIYRMNDTMYYKMPPIFHFENYASCLSDPEGVYCTPKLVLVSDTSNDLLNIIRNYSEDRIKHYNHSQLLYGICVTQSCRSYYYDTDGKGNLSTVLEKCLNDTILKKYELKARVMEPLTCNTKNDKIDIEYMDFAVAGICLGLILINFIGTVYHIFYVSKKERKGSKFLMIFSMKRNWERLVSPADDTNHRMQFFKGFNGVRTITTALVITAHTFVPFINFASNAHAIEGIYDNILYHTFINGTPIVQIFFVMSGFLLAYNIQIKSEKLKITWRAIPMGIWLRWLRLTPSYAIVLAITTTWLRFVGSGPAWHEAVVSEIEDCRRTGWQNLLYINNYFDDTQCMAQTWYLAADMQLSCLGIVICVLLKTNYARKIVLSLLFAAGVIIPGVVTYMMDLDGVLIVSPTTSINFFVSDPTFNNIYKRGHTNLAGYIIGLSLGYITYHLIQMKFDVQKYKKYLWIYQLLIPTGLLMLWMGIIFYRDAPRDPVIIRALYASLMKPIFTTTISLFVLGLIFKCDKSYRGIFELRFWATTGRLSYCAYIIHIMVIRTYTGTRDVTMTFLFLHAVHFCISSIILTFLLAIPLWLLVEAPMNELLKVIFATSVRSEEPKKVKSTTSRL